jgi:hypothetical protein
MKNQIKYILLIILGLILITQNNVNAQTKYGNTLNAGLGIGGYSGYYSYTGRSIPVINLNYELDVAKNFTIAPFVSFYTLSRNYYWGNNNVVYRNYTYRETVIPIGIKGSYYFDDYLKANPKWDFYLAGSIGFAIVNRTWDDGNGGDKNYFNNAQPIILDVHIGTEYHFNNKIGAFLDLSSGVSTIGLSFHTK